MATMALDNCFQPGTVFKEGYLVKERRVKLDSKKWWVLTQDRGPVFSRYEDSSKSKPEKIIHGLEISKHKHDNFISVRHGKKILHLRAENRQQRDEWYTAAKILLDCAPAADDDLVPQPRMRIQTDTSKNRPPIHRGRAFEDPQTAPSQDAVFRKELNQGSRSPHKPDADDSDVAKVRQPPPLCCLKNHVVACNSEGKNMADLEVVYENVHFVRSEKEHFAAIERRKDSLAHGEDLYNLHHDIKGLQVIDESSVYEIVIVGGQQGQDDGLNDLSSQEQHNNPPADFHHNIPTDARGSLGGESNEDNTEVNDTTVKRSPPPVPIHTGQQLRKKIQKLKEEQWQVHGIEREFFKTSLIGERVKIELMEKNDGIWVIGLEEGGMQLRGSLKVGDQLIKVNKQILPSAMFARDTIRSTDEDKVTLKLKRIPHGFVCTITRDSPDDDLGITLEGNEITNVLPQGLACSRGDLKPQTTGLSGRMCNWAITEINTQPVDLFATTDDIQGVLRRAGREIALVVQPVDFIQMMRDKLNSPTPSSVKT